jgi:hypothetical protein
MDIFWGDLLLIQFGEEVIMLSIIVEMDCLETCNTLTRTIFNKAILKNELEYFIDINDEQRNKFEFYYCKGHYYLILLELFLI